MVVKKGEIEMTTALSGKITLWVNRFLFLVMVVLCFTVYDLLTWFAGVRQLPWQVSAVILVAFYLCVPVAGYALWCIEGLLKNILAGEVFIMKNVRYVRRIRWCCAGVSGICLPAAFFYPPLFFVVVMMAFLALMVSVVKTVLAAAVELREENDLTI